MKPPTMPERVRLARIEAAKERRDVVTQADRRHAEQRHARELSQARARQQVQPEVRVSLLTRIWRLMVRWAS